MNTQQVINQSHGSNIDTRVTCGWCWADNHVEQHAVVNVTLSGLMYVIYNYGFLFVDKITGMDTVWFWGDNFVASSYRKYFLNRPTVIEETVKDEFFIKSNYGYDVSCNSRYNSPTKNILIRLRNAFASAINKSIHLPKYIIIILDGDLIDFLEYEGQGMSQILGDWITWLSKELTLMIEDKKGKLPVKAKRFMEPCVYWSLAPLHIGFGEAKNSPIRG